MKSGWIVTGQIKAFNKWNRK